MPPPSPALTRWRTDRGAQLETASRLAAAAATPADADLLTRAYVLVLAAEFQGFFTDLLSDIGRTLVDALPDEVPPPLRAVLLEAMRGGRMVEFRNPDATTLRRDLIRFDVSLRHLARGGAPGGPGLDRLGRLIATRNKLAHGSGAVGELGPDGGRLTADVVDEWWRDVDQLAATLDNVVAVHLTERLSIAAW
jgi:hypothetical protein